MDHKTATYTTRTTRHWHKLFLCAGLIAALGMEECALNLVSIDSPADGTMFTEAQTVTITASALEGEGLTVAEVRFYRNDDELMGTDTTAPYTYAWAITDADNGIHRFSAEADYTSPDGEETLRSDEVVYTVAVAEDAFPPVGRGVLGTLEGVGFPLELALDHESRLAIALGNSSQSNGSNGLAIFDLRDPSQPKLSARVDFEDLEVGVAIEGAFAYVVEQGEDAGTRLAVLDLSEPRQPRVLRRIVIPEALAGSARRGGGIVVEGGLAYVGNAFGLHVVDVTRPEAPRIVHSVETNMALYGQIVIGEGFLVTSAVVELAGRLTPQTAWFDTRDPARPLLMGTVPLVGRLATAGPTLYVGRGFDMFIFDVSDVSKASYVAKPAKVTNDMVVEGGRLYITSRAGLDAFDASIVYPLELIDQFAFPGFGRRVAASGDMVVATDIGGSLHVIGVPQ